jgi:hypothetical protein
MSTNAETATNEAIKEALKAIQRALELSERVGYGSQILAPLRDAQRDAQYAYETAMGRN